MIQIKPGVVVCCLGPASGKAIGEIMAAVEKVWTDHWWGNPTITGGIDGTHMDGSRHYDGLALDVRFPKWPNPTEEAINEAVADLTVLLPLYDVVKEKTHLHVELHDKP